VAGSEKNLDRKDVQPLADLDKDVRDLISGSIIEKSREIELKPYQVMWLQF
jgi:hypothetical protein